MNDNSGNVVAFPKPGDRPEVKQEEVCEECGGDVNTLYVATCSECNCRSFELLSNGAVECANCGHRVNGQYEEETQWRRVLPPLPEIPENVPDDSDTVKVSRHGHAEFAKKGVLKKVNEWAKDNELAAVFSFNVNGSGKHWSSAETEEQRDWIIRKLKFVIEHMMATAYNKDEGLT